MANNELQEQALQSIIEQSVDDAVKRAFKKYGRRSWRALLSPKRLLSLLVILAVLGGGIWLHERSQANEPVAPVEDHDLTLENDGIFGFKASDFEEPILGEAARRQQLIVEEREVYVNTTITDTGLFNLGVFNKQQALTIHGTGQYTIDLTKINRSSFNSVINEMNLGSIIYPRVITADYILKYVRSTVNSINSNVETLYKLAGGKAEALEFIIKENSAVAGIPLQDLNFRKNTLICCIYRNGKVILPGGQDMMLAGDSVLVVISGYRISDIKEILED